VSHYGCHFGFDAFLGNPSLALRLFLFLEYGYAGCDDEAWLPLNPNLS
jgi:hypothetical protein